MCAETATATPEVIVLNGASSAGKTTLAVALQDILNESWLVFGIDTLIGALPLALVEMDENAVIQAWPRDYVVRAGGIAFDAEGEVEIGDEFRRLESNWQQGLSTIAASGTKLILDEVFLDGVRSQDRLDHALAGRTIAWVGVTCNTDVAQERERGRGDRVVGMFERQSKRVHDGVHYDLVVDTSSSSAHDVAHQIARRFNLATT